MSYGSPEITYDSIKCEECGKYSKKIAIQHLKLHGLTIPEYKKKWGYTDKQPLEALYIKELRQNYNKEYEAWKNIKNHPKAKPFKKGQVRDRSEGMREQERLHLQSIAVNIQHTEGFRLTHIKSSKLKWQDMDYREKSIATYRKIYNTPEAKERFSKNSLKYWSNPDNRKKASDIRKAIWNTPEKKEFASQRALKYWKNKKETALSN